MTPEDKKAAKKAANDLTLHVALIMRDVESKATATALAYHEGRAGLAARLNPAGGPK